MLTANCVVLPFADETKDGGTLAAGVALVWRFLELGDMKPGLNTWASLSPESLGQAAASSRRVERLGRGDLVEEGQLCTPGSGTPEPYRKPLWAEVPLRPMINLGVNVSNSRRATTTRDSPGSFRERSRSGRCERRWAESRRRLSRGNDSPPTVISKTPHRGHL